MYVCLFVVNQRSIKNYKTLSKFYESLINDIKDVIFILIFIFKCLVINNLQFLTVN
jgi:hypothetical protein